MLLPLGYDNFKELIDYRLDFVDKSLFIQEVLGSEWFENFLNHLLTGDLVNPS